jgi:polar amino acid transport system permease protein
MPYDWNFLVILKYLPKILEGGLHTLALAAASIAVAAPLGIFFGIVRHQRIPFLLPIAVIYIDFFRTSVALVLIYWCYFALPVLLGINLDTFTAVTIAISLQASAYMAELVRAGLKSISTGQWEAARALGMPGHVRMRYIILPQAARRMIPLLFLLMIEIVKTTTLAGVVTYPEIVYEAYRVATEIYRPIETFTLVGLICFLFLFTAGRIAIWLEWRFAIVER